MRTPVQLDQRLGKRDEQSVAATADCCSSSRRLFATDKETKCRFLIDTGSDLCCYPKRLVRGRHQPTSYQLRAANGTVINTYGDISLNLNFGLRRDFRWRFILADVDVAIIGSDFLSHYHLLPDCKNKRLVDGTTGLAACVQFSNNEQVSVKVISAEESPFNHILSEYPDITRPPGIERQIKHTTVHYIHTTEGPPISCRPRRLGPSKLAAAKKEFADMMSCGTARPSTSPWSSPLHLAQKRDTSWRPCGDYRALNARTIPDRYPVRHIGDFNQGLSGATVFSTIDLAKAYQQIPVFEPHICKTAIITPFGLFEHPFMGFGLRNAGQTFQRFIDEVVQGLDFCYSYVDDILVYSKNSTEHAEHLRTIFQRLQAYGVVVNPSKCHLGLAEVVFLGYHISAGGIKPPDERISALRDFPTPKTVQGMRRFLGMMNYYRRFLPSAAQYQAPLIDAVTAVNGKGAKPFPWTPELEQQFTNCKNSLATATLLAHPDASAPLGLFTDASSTHVGSCLQQKIRGEWQPLAFFSKKLNEKQAIQPAYYRELLGVYESVQHFRHILEVQQATIFTDHKPLLYAFIQRRERLPPQQLNQLSFISQFTTDIQHIKGADNVVADAMSRIESISLEIDYSALEKAQHDDDELKHIQENTSLTLQNITIPGTDIKILCDLSTGKPRPYLPAPLRRAAFNRLHDLSHPGARASARMVADRHVWPNMQKDCRTWARTCIPCQRAKVSRHITTPVGNFNTPTGRFQHIHMDIIGPLPYSNGHTYCLTVVDRFTRWAEAWPMVSITAVEVAEKFMYGWIARYGVPATITTDQGRQFESDLFQRLTNICGTKRVRTTSYHPQANGMVERMHRQLKAAIMCHSDTWFTALPMVLLGLRSALKEDLQCSAAELVYGEPLRLPGELVVPVNKNSPESSEFVAQLRTKMAAIRAVPASRHTNPASFIHKDLATASHVFLRDDTVRRSLQTPYTGPYKITSRGTKIISLEIGGKEVAVSVDRVKPAHLDTCALPFSPSQNTESSLIPGTPPPLAPPPSPPPSAPGPVPPVTTRSGRRVRFTPIFDL